ncbi:MAG: multiheme c-type cytochrome [Planctomycetota bacterium]|jgi:formate-dependent nitrite reductase cytochrome c552 subunit
MCEARELESASASLGLGKWTTFGLFVIPLVVMSSLVYVFTRVRPADNSYCFVCHLNYQEEPLAENHRAHGIGCAKCHGPSDAHVEDEAAETAPETMYARSRINPACRACHAEPALRTECKSAVSTAAAAPGVCTDCHGEHRLVERTRKWDKKTGELTWTNGEGMGM